MHLPPEFLSSVRRLLGDEADALFASISEDPVTSVRYNKLRNIAVKPGDVVPWCIHARYLPYRPQFTLDPLFHAGVYYVQEASSMLLYEVLQQTVAQTNPVVLDLCGAPGGKSTLILDFLGHAGILITNEVIRSRAGILAENIRKWGHTNAIVTTNDAADFTNTDMLFDAIIVDAPCSGEGMFRKSENAVNDWSKDNVDLCSARQKRILADVLPNLKQDGIIIYSTCTFNQEENIDNVSWMCNEFGMQAIQLKMDPSWGITEICQNQAYGYQCYPHKTKGEGFFVSALIKKNAVRQKEALHPKNNLRYPDKKEMEILKAWVEIPSDHEMLITDKGHVYLFPHHMVPYVNECIQKLRLVYSGVKCGKIDRTLFLPDHSLVYSPFIASTIPRFEVDKDTAIKYLKKELYSIESDIKSWLLVTYQGHGLGWIKNLGNRINNYLPSELMIRKNL